MDTLKIRILTSNKLKLIAIIAMTIDHCAAILFPVNFPAIWLLRLIGRLTAPIMCFSVASGYHHTSDVNKYAWRLFLLAIFSHIPYNLAFGFRLWKIWEATSVMLSLFLGLVALMIYKMKKLSVWIKVVLIAVCCLLSYSAAWNYIAVLWILGFGIFYGNIYKQIIAFSAVNLLYLLKSVVYNTSFPFVSQLGVFLVIPFLLMYNGKLGKKSNVIKWGFYGYYPTHLLCLYGIAAAFNLCRT